jgi:hypothetical protein
VNQPKYLSTELPGPDLAEEDPQELVENAEYDLTIAKHAWSGRSLAEIDGDLAAARAAERSAVLNDGDVATAQTVRFGLMHERTKCLNYLACLNELRAAQVRL